MAGKMRWGFHELETEVIPPINVDPECLGLEWASRDLYDHDKARCLGWRIQAMTDGGMYVMALPGDPEPTWALSPQDVRETFDGIFKMVNTGTTLQPTARLLLWDEDDYRTFVEEVAQAIFRTWPHTRDMYQDQNLVWYINRRVQESQWVDSSGGRRLTVRFSTRVPSDADLVDFLPATTTPEHWDRGRAAFALTADIWDEVLAIHERERQQRMRSGQRQVFFPRELGQLPWQDGSPVMDSYGGVTGLGEEEEEMSVRGTPFSLPPGQEWETQGAYWFMVKRLALGMLSVQGTLATNVTPVQTEWMKASFDQIAQFANVHPKDGRTLAWIKTHSLYEPSEAEIRALLKWVVPPGEAIPPHLEMFATTVQSFIGDIWNMARHYKDHQVPEEEGGALFTRYYKAPSDPVDLEEPWDEPGHTEPPKPSKPS